jgi:hypothetical protein
MDNKQFLLEAFHDDLVDTTWLLDKDILYANKYFYLLSEITNAEVISDYDMECFIEAMYELKLFFYERAKNSADWVAPKTRAANELIHDENGKLTQDSVELLQITISDKSGEKTLISDTGKTISFGEKWYQMINSCSFKTLAVDKLTDFISKFIEADGWSKYFVGNIGRNLKRQIQEYHIMDKYNLKHGTSYAAMHHGGDTTKCVLVSVDTGTPDGKGEPKSMTFLEIGAHTIIDRFIMGSLNRTAITEAGPDELAELFEIN